MRVRWRRANPAAWAGAFWPGTQPSLEAQLCNLADEIAYNTHDIDDGVRSGLLAYEQLLELPAFAGFHREALGAFADLGGRRLLFEMLRRMLSAQVHDLIGCSARRSPNAHRKTPTRRAGRRRWWPSVATGRRRRRP